MEEEEELLIEKLEEIEFENIDEEFIEDNEDDESSEEDFGLGNVKLEILYSTLCKPADSPTMPPPENSGYIADPSLGKRVFMEVYDTATLESWLRADILQEVP